MIIKVKYLIETERELVKKVDLCYYYIYLYNIVPTIGISILPDTSSHNLCTYTSFGGGQVCTVQVVIRMRQLFFHFRVVFNFVRFITHCNYKKYIILLMSYQTSTTNN